MPGVYQYGYTNLNESLKPLVAKGLKSVLLFAAAGKLSKVIIFMILLV